MAPAPSPRDLLIAAKTQVARATRQLEQAREETRRLKVLKDRTDWLADRPDLLSFVPLIEDLPRRQAQLTQVRDEFHRQDEFKQVYDARIRERTQAELSKAQSDLEKKIALYRRLLKVVDNHDALIEALRDYDSDAPLLSLLNDLGLDGEIWVRLEILVTLEDRARKRAGSKANRGIRAWYRSYTQEMADVYRKWKPHVLDMRQELHELEDRRDNLESEQFRRHRSDVEAELDMQNPSLVEAAKALAEAKEAISHQTEIDKHIAHRIEQFEAEQTRDAQAAFDAANKAYENARNQCTFQFQTCLEQDFLIARIEDFAPADDQSFRQQLEDAKASFARDWPSRHTRANLDLEQAAAIGSVHENVLVTARAGSGKTSTLVTRTAFLVKHCRVSPDELLLLVFNKKAAEEMRGRLQKMGCDIPHVMTFHALAYAIVHPDEALIYDSPDDTQLMLSRAFQQVLNEFMDRDRFREEIQKVMLGHFRADWDKLTRAGLTLSREEGLAYRRALAKESLNGDYVKSFGEKAIANFLFEHDIPYKYEKSHRWSGRNYRPDFTIPLGQYGIVIEYFGLIGDPDYDTEAEEKRNYWRRKPDWRFIEMMPAELNQGIAHFQDTLRRRLEACGITCRRLSEEKVWARIRDRSITRFTLMTRIFVGRCRVAGLSPAALQDRIDRHKSLSDVEATFLRMAAAIFTAYLARLSAVGEEDFSGLLERAATNIENGEKIFDRKSGRGDLSKMRFVLVDEFQDFSPLFLRMLQAARRHNPGMQMFCVGDDWQAINAFAGSDIQYFERFDEHFTPAVRLPIATNYRSAPCVVELGNLLMKGRGIEARPGKDHAGRILIADLSRFEPSAIEREMYGNTSITPVVRRILFKALEGSGRVALLRRRNFKRKDADLPHVWKKGLSDEQKERVSIDTAHKYKGLQAETVVILDAIQRSYPLIHPDWVFTRVLGDSVQKLIEDDRHLFYVACTRAINTLILITEINRESDFLSEIKGKCAMLQWQDFPSVENSSPCWIVKVGNRLGLGSKPTRDVKDDLDAHGFKFSGSKWQHWERIYPATNDGFQSVLKSLSDQTWAKKGSGLEVRICDQNESVLGVYWVDGGTFRPAGPN
jgi:DNA helicase-4